MPYIPRESLIHVHQETFTRKLQFSSSVAQSCPTLCDPMNCSTPGLPAHHQLLESTQTHVHWVSGAIQPSHPLSSPSPPALNLSQHIKKQRHYFANKGPSSQGYGFSSGHVWMWELYYKESWATKNWCFWTVVLEKTLQSPLDCKEIQPVHPEAETPILWPPDAKSWLIWKDKKAYCIIIYNGKNLEITRMFNNCETDK